MRLKMFVSILVFCLILLLGGLGYVQIYRHDKYKTMSEENRLKVVSLRAPRGSIFDRKGNALVKDVVSFNVSVIYSRIRDKKALKDILTVVLGVPDEDIKAGIEKSRWRPYSPVCVARDVGIEKATHVEEIGIDYPGLLLEVSPKREYLYGKTASSVLGYLGFINRAEFNKLKHYGHTVNDLVGRAGVEQYYDDYLRGKIGGKQIEVDHRGRESMVLGYREPIPGKNITLTIDLELQKFCESLLKKKQGAIVVMDPSTGAIRVMASAPAYDPNIFVDRSRNKEIGNVLRNSKYPLLNRAISGTYPPGSVFKIIVAAGALERDIISTEMTFNCTGIFHLGKAKFHCWKKRGHGEVSMEDAIKYSCNIYFFNLGLLLGVDKIAEYSSKFGLGKKTGIEIYGEKGGTLPDRKWKRKRFGTKWYPGDTVNFSIGQGYLLCTPIQIARFLSIFANGGYLVTPYLVSDVGGIPVGKTNKIDLGLQRSTLKIIREGLRRVVNDPRGTGMKARQDDLIVAGKTGTAQTSRGKSHGWFMGMAPFNSPKLVVVIFDEYGGKGGYYAAGTAGKVFGYAKKLGLL